MDLIRPGIVHACTHNNDDSLVLTEDEMMMAVFSYLEFLFDTVSPKKLLFIAIDGVAPRAKMNQQRQRRFRNAKSSTAAEPLNKAKESPFDSNCITPGMFLASKVV